MSNNYTNYILKKVFLQTFELIFMTLSLKLKLLHLKWQFGDFLTKLWRLLFLSLFSWWDVSGRRQTMSCEPCHVLFACRNYWIKYCPAVGWWGGKEAVSSIISVHMWNRLDSGGLWWWLNTAFLPYFIIGQTRDLGWLPFH